MVALGGGSPWALALWVAAAIVGLRLARLGWRSPEYRNRLLLSWLIVPIALSVCVSIYLPIFKDRYLVEVLPAFALLAGIGIASVPRWIGAAAFGLAALSSVFVLGDDYELRQTQAWREAVAFAQEHAEPDDGWIFVSRWGQNGFEYYAGWGWGQSPAAPYRHVLQPIDWRQARVSSRAAYHHAFSIDELARFADRHRRIWLVMSGGYETEEAARRAATEPIRDWLEDRGYNSDNEKFPGITLIRYELDSSYLRR